MSNFNWLNQWRDVGRKVGHSPFSLDKKQAFGLPNSQIVPIHFIETVPGDHFQINLAGLMRTKTLNTAAFYGGKMFVNVFFVPYSQLWHPFNQFVTQKSDQHSTRFQGHNYAPTIREFDLANFIVDVFNSGKLDQFGFPMADNIVKMCQFAKIKNFYPLLSILRNNGGDTDLAAAWINANCRRRVGHSVFYPRVNLFRVAAYQHIFYDFYRNKFYDEECFCGYDDGTQHTERMSYVESFNFDDLECTSASNNYIAPSGETWDLDDYMYPSYDDARIANLFYLHYHQYRKDLFTSLMPSTQFGAVSGIGFDLSATASTSITGNGSITSSTDVGRWRSSTGGSIGNNTVVTEESGGVLVSQNLDSIKHDHQIASETIASHLSPRTIVSLSDAYMNVLDWRRAELLQQWKQNALRAGNMVDDNFEAHYGVKPYYEDDNNVRFLGGFECRLDINAVVANAATGESVNGNVGDIAGIGVGTFKGNTIDCQIKDFGVIVACASFVSDTYYNADGTDKNNMKVEPFDFFNKEFENVGFDSVQLGLENANLGELSDYNLGFTPPYTEHKTAVDEVYGSFVDTIYESGDGYEVWRGDMRQWVVSRQDFYYYEFSAGLEHPLIVGVNKNRFYQPPSLVDNIFEVAYDGTILTDPYSFSISWNVKAIRPMTVLGIPIFA